jgi:hypothetical protein
LRRREGNCLAVKQQNVNPRRSFQRKESETTSVSWNLLKYSLKRGDRTQNEDLKGTGFTRCEKTRYRHVLYQGTTSVVPQVPQNKRCALAPAKLYRGFHSIFKPFSAACLAPKEIFH